jgi:glycerol-1-phosphate dehydrogenase [NAD(P)+]
MSSSEILESVVPRSIIIGKSILDKLSNVILSLGKKPKIVILTGPHTKYIVGETIYNIISNQGLESEMVIIENSSLETANTYVDQVEQYNPDILISAGGGKTIDVGKYCLLKNSRKIELISVPTATPHDGIASPFIFLDDPTETFIGECRTPVAILADVDIILQHPDLVRYLAAGVGDTVGKITAIWDWKYAWRMKSERFSRFVGGVLENADTLFQNQVSEALIDPEYAIQVVLKALLIAGVLMGTSNDIRVGYGSEHMISAALHSEIPSTKILHGERIAISAILMARLQGQDHTRIIEILSKVGCPTNIDDLEEEVTSEALIRALQKAHNITSMYTILGRTGLTKIAAWNLARETGVIS